MVKQEDTSKQIMGEVKIKTEPGTSVTPGMQRLPSLRPPRDLSLSAYSQKIPNLNAAKNKKIYVPNLNVQRNKPSENSTTTTKSDPAKPNIPEASVRGRGRGKRNLIQLNEGVFAQGIPGQQRYLGRGGGGGGGGGDSTDNVLRKPTLKMTDRSYKVDKKEEESTMKELLKDDFVDDPSMEPDFKNCPVYLPQSKEEPDWKKKFDLKGVDKKECKTFSEVFYDSSLGTPGYCLFQLPSSMPGLYNDTVEETTSTSVAAQAADSKPTGGRCLLSNLPPGQIGKLQVLRSGKTRLLFGDIKMKLDMGTQVNFEQDLVSVELDKSSHTGLLHFLSAVNIRMVATPDWVATMANLKVQAGNASSNNPNLSSVKTECLENREELL